jgi:hypothetical protein
VKAHAELDVLHRRAREGCSVTSFVEAAQLGENVTSDGSEASPEGRRNTRALLMDMVVEEVPKVRNDAAPTGVIVVRAEDSREIAVTVERFSDSGEGIVVDFDIRVHEHENVAPGLRGAAITCGPRAERARPVNND